MAEQEAGREHDPNPRPVGGMDPEKYHKITMPDGSTQVVSGPLPTHEEDRDGRREATILRREVLALRRAVIAYEGGTTFDVDQETSEAIDRAFDWHNPDGRVGPADHHLPELEAALRTPTPEADDERE